jgi:hypothetical protein
VLPPHHEVLAFAAVDSFLHARATVMLQPAQLALTHVAASVSKVTRGGTVRGGGGRPADARAVFRRRPRRPGP